MKLTIDKNAGMGYLYLNELYDKSQYKKIKMNHLEDKYGNIVDFYNIDGKDIIHGIEIWLTNQFDYELEIVNINDDYIFMLTKNKTVNESDSIEFGKNNIELSYSDKELVSVKIHKDIIQKHIVC